MDAQPDLQRRAFHRVQFPLAEQPRWIVGDTSFAVVDLSESSCRLARGGHDAINLEQTWNGVLRFVDGDQIWIEGTAIRLDHDAIVVQFVKGVTFRKIMSLQRGLLRKYPARQELRP